MRAFNISSKIYSNDEGRGVRLAQLRIRLSEREGEDEFCCCYCCVAYVRVQIIQCSVASLLAHLSNVQVDIGPSHFIIQTDEANA